nr:MAG TPA: hypothetical protein [Caudoviricetes sp.]
MRDKDPHSLAFQIVKEQVVQNRVECLIVPF